MTTLTDEQRKRIEENKRKAQAIRATKLANGTSKTPTTSTNTGFTLLSSNTGTSKTPILPVSINNGSLKFSTSIFAPQSKGCSKWNTNSSGSPTSNYSNLANNNTKIQNIDDSKVQPMTNFYNSSSKQIVVNLTLISKDRFCAEFPFNKAVVDVLKTIPGKLYDPVHARWHFPLSSYNDCKTALQSCKECIVKPLPNYILKVFYHQKKINIDYKTIDISRIDETLHSCLYPFQVEGVQFGISKNGRCIIADDMGLGKTVQALGIAHYYYNDWPLLIVCPSSMRYQWEEEIRNYLPKIPLTKIFVLSKSKEQIHNPLVLITSYDLMSRCITQLTTLKFGVVIMDESHCLKSLKTNRTKTALVIIEKAKRCILLSGTPALSRPLELYAQIKAIEPHAFTMKEFGLRYCDGKEGKFGWDYSGSSNMIELKILLEERFMIRRLKSEVLNQLPSKIRQVVVLDKDALKVDTKLVSAFSAKLNNENIKGQERRGTMLSYFAETAKMKLRAIKDYICQILEAGNKFLVFAHHKIVLDEICQLLEEKKTYFIRVDGAVNSEERKSVCDQFQTEEKFRVAVLSITAASTGLTLTAANLVVFAELFWNPGILTQAEDRVHRIGQQDSVLVQYLIATGTADDYVWPLIKEKLHILNKAGLSKDSFSCEHTSVTTTPGQRTILDYFDDLDFDADLSQIVDEIEELESKRMRLH